MSSKNKAAVASTGSTHKTTTTVTGGHTNNNNNRSTVASSINSSVVGNVSTATTKTTPSVAAATTPVTNSYQRFDYHTTSNSNSQNHHQQQHRGRILYSQSYDSEDSYGTGRSPSDYINYNYMSTSIRDTLRKSHNTTHGTTTTKHSSGHHLMTDDPDASSSSSSSSSSEVVVLTEEDQQRIQYLALRKFHIPGHTFTQDYIYWFCNNHPFFCFCYADARHPLGTIERIINLVSSLAFGLAATCCVVLYFYYKNEHLKLMLQNSNSNEQEQNYNNNGEDYNAYDDNNNNIYTDHEQYDEYVEDSLMQFHHVVFTIPFVNIKITTGIVTLLIFSGPLHVLFDLGIYFLQACPPCRVNGCCYIYQHNINNTGDPTKEVTTTSTVPNKDGPLTSKHHHHHHHRRRSCWYACMRLLYRQECWLWVGTYVAFCITVAAVSLALQVTLLRASIMEEQDDNDSNISYHIQHYDFMLYYLLEIFVANFIAFPIGTFTMFSGVLGCCGRIPGLGGRPYQVRKHQKQQQDQEEERQRRQRQHQELLSEQQSIAATTVKRSNVT